MSKDCANKKPLNVVEKHIVQRLTKFSDEVMSALLVTCRIGDEVGNFQSELVQLHPGKYDNERKMSMHGVRGLVVDLVKGRIVRLGLTPTLETIVTNGLGSNPVNGVEDLPTAHNLPIRPQVVGSVTQTPGSMYPGAWDSNAVPIYTPAEKEDDEYYTFSIDGENESWIEELRIEDSVIMPHYPGVALTVFLWKGKIYISSNKAIDIESGNSRWADNTETFFSMLSKISGFDLSILYPPGTQNSTRVHYFYLVHPSFNICSNVIINPDGFLIYDGFIDLMNDPTIWEDKSYLYVAPTIADKNISKLKELSGVVSRWTINHDTANVILRLGYVVPFALVDPKRINPGETIIIRNLTTGISVSVQGEGRKYINKLFNNNINIYQNFVNIMGDACRYYQEDDVDKIEDFMRKYPIVAYPTSERLVEMIESRKTLISYLQVIANPQIQAYSAHQKIDMLHYLLLSFTSEFYANQMLNFRNRFYYDIGHVVSFILENLNNHNNHSIFNPQDRDDKRLAWVIREVIKQTRADSLNKMLPMTIGLYMDVAWRFMLYECSDYLYWIIRSVYRRVPDFKRNSIKISEPGVYTYKEIQAMKVTEDGKMLPEILPETISAPANLPPVDESKIETPIEDLAIEGETYNDGQ